MRAHTPVAPKASGGRGLWSDELAAPGGDQDDGDSDSASFEEFHAYMQAGRVAAESETKEVRTWHFTTAGRYFIGPTH